METTPIPPSKPNKGFGSLFNAPTDIPAFIIIALGIGIAALMEDLPVRLIGVCISILGSLAIFILYAQRVKDLSALQEPTKLDVQQKPVKTVSEVSDFKTTVKQETGGTKRLVFDDFAESFGIVEDDAPTSAPSTASVQSQASERSSASSTQSSTSKKSQSSEASSKKKSPQPSSAQAQPQPAPQQASTQPLPKRLVFDDFDDTADFDDVNSVQLVTAPEKYTAQAPPSVLPTPPSAFSQALTSSDSSIHATSSGKKVLVFDDSDESAALANDFEPTIAVGATTLPDSLKKVPEPEPVTPAPKAFVRPTPQAGNYTPPILDESLLGADFDDEEGGEFRILGKVSTTESAVNFVNPAPQEDLAKKKSNDNTIEGHSPLVISHLSNDATTQPMTNDQLTNDQLTNAIAPAEPITQITEAEAVQDKVARASKAALHVETIEKEIREISAVASTVVAGQTSDAAAQAQAADVRMYRAEKGDGAKEKVDASKIAAGQVSTELPEDAVSHRRKKLSVTMDDIAEETPEVVKNEPRREFDFLLQRILMAIRSAMNARTAAYWWYAADRKQLTMEAKISDVPDHLQNRTIAITETDAVSQIALTGTPEIVTEISPDAELSLLPYYAKPSRTRSFVGVPVFYNNAVVGILSADSTEDDAYDNATVSFLGHFTKLIAGLIQSYTEKYDLLQAARTLEAIDTFRQLTLKPERTGEDICTALIRSLMRLVPYSTMGTCIYNDDTTNWYISNLHTKVAEARSILGSDVVLESSLLGKTITNGRTYRFQNLTPNFVRISDKETPSENLAFTAIPLVSVSRCYGALFIEEIGDTRLTKQDIEILETACEYAGTALEQIQLQDYVQTHAMYREAADERVVSAIDFLVAARKEISTAKETAIALSIALVQLDEYAAFANNDALREELFQKFTAAVKKNARENDVLGRYVGNVVGICLLEKNTQEAKMWAERLRREIASQPLNVNGKQFTITASIGIATLGKQSSAEELFTQAEQALNLAVQTTNRVNVFA
jgi:diguanylate cyclase (GGDEF)-like protein